MIIVIMGLPGTGKTTFARLLAIKINAIHLSSDVIRQSLKLSGLYDPQHKMDVYRQLISLTEECLKTNQIVVLDAGFHFRSQRELVIQLCNNLEIQSAWIRMTADERDIKKRVDQPRLESEANWQVYKLLKEQFEPLLEDHLLLNTSKMTPAEMISQAIVYLSLEKEYP